MTQKVWVTHIHHRHGDDLFAHGSKEGALNHLETYCREWWKYEGIAGHIPDQREELIERYFERMLDFNEWYEMEECEVQP